MEIKEKRIVKNEVSSFEYVIKMDLEELLELRTILHDIDYIISRGQKTDNGTWTKETFYTDSRKKDFDAFMIQFMDEMSKHF